MKKCLFEKEKKCYFCCCCSCHLGERLECLHFYPSKPQAPPEGQQLHLRERVKWKSERVARMNERKRQGDRRSRTRREKVVPYTADITAAMAQTYLYKVKKEEPEKRKKKSHVLRDKFNTLRLLGFTWVTNHRPAEHIFGRHAVCQGSQWVRGQGSWVISGGGAWLDVLLCCWWVEDIKKWRRIIRAAERATPPSLCPRQEDIQSEGCRARAVKTVKDVSHPGHGLFCGRGEEWFLPSGHRRPEKTLTSSAALLFLLAQCCFYCTPHPLARIPGPKKNTLLTDLGVRPAESFAKNEWLTCSLVNLFINKSIRTEGKLHKYDAISVPKPSRSSLCHCGSRDTPFCRAQFISSFTSVWVKIFHSTLEIQQMSLNANV